MAAIYAEGKPIPAFTVQVFNLPVFIDNHCLMKSCDCWKTSNNGTNCIIMAIVTHVPGGEYELVSQLRERESAFPNPTSALVDYFYHFGSPMKQDIYSDNSIALILPPELNVGHHDQLFFEDPESRFGMTLSEVLEKHLL